MKQLLILTLSILSTNLFAQTDTVKKIDANLPLTTDSTKVLIPIGEKTDTFYFKAIFIQEKEFLKIEKGIVCNRYYLFTDPKFNRLIEQWFVKVPSALTPTVSGARMTPQYFEENTVWFKLYAKP